MKKMLVMAAAAFMVAALGMAYTAMAAKPMTMTMEGYIIDTKCATANSAKLAEFAPTHPKECAMAPDCRKSGYNLYSEGKLWKFDKASSDKVYSFLKKADSTLHVKVEMEHGKGDTIKLVSITNAK